MSDTAFTWDDLDTEEPAATAQPAPVEAVKPLVSPAKKPVKKRAAAPAKAKQTEARKRQLKFYVTDSELAAFNELRGAVPASAFLYTEFQEMLK